MELSFEQAVYLFVKQYREQQLNRISELFRNDGGPGSGNHGHQGVPGQVGGSAPSEHRKPNACEKQSLLRFTGDNRTISEQDAQNIESAIAASEPLSSDYEYSRGVSLTKEELDKLISDGFYRPNRLTSWSADTSVAESFAYEGTAWDDEKYPVVLQYRGTALLDKGMEISDYSQVPDEDEFVFSKSIRMKVARNEVVGYDPDDCPTGTVYINLYDDDRNDGGPGSGNWGHEGVPGQVGGSAPGNGSRQVVEGKDISRTYNGDRSTKAVIEAQGFGGLPKIVGKKEFDKAVKESKFIAQRSVTASSQEILDAYRNELFNGDFYVDCTVGGAGYGQGMYCAADYNGELSDGIKEEMQHYRKIGDRKFGRPSYEETKQKALKKIEEQYKDDPDYDEICRYAEEVCKPDWTMATFVDADLTIEQVSQVENIVRSVKQQTDAPDYTATMTLDPSAKIVDYDTIKDMLSTERTERWYQAKQDTVRTETEKLGLQGGALDYFRQRLGLQNVDPYDDDAAEEWKSKASRKELQSVNKEADRIALWALTDQKVVEEMYKDLDIGAYAALKGYDAINARGHGASGSYTVILNRTKTIFLDDDIHEDAKDEEGKITFQIGADGVTYAIRNRKVIGWVRAFDSSESNNSDRSDGGPGSGNFGHEGRPGEVGGSGPAEYAGMSDEGKSVIKAHLKDPYHFGQSDEQKASNRQKLIRALSDIGVKVEHDEENDTYSAICTDMSYEENKALDGALNQGAFSYGVDRETYIQKCNEEGKPIRLHETPTEVYDGWLWSKSGKRQTDGTPVHRDMTKEQVLSDDDLVKYSGLDGTVNPTGKAEAEKARDAAMASMSDAEISALNDYTRQWHGANYAAVNQYLVTGEGSEQAKTAAAKITSATDHPIGVDCITCRGDQSIFGTGRDEEIGKLVRKVERGDYSSARKLRDMLVGETVTNQAAMSTSPNDPTSGYGQRPVQYIFRTPKDAKAVDITSVSAFGGGRSEAEKKLAATGLFGSVEHEAEVLYKPGTRYKIADVQFSMSVDRKGKKTGQVIIVADILTDNEDSRADADEPEKWITINGAHVPLDENGEMQGKVADRIKAEKASSETAMHPASTEYDYSDGDSEDEWIQKNVRKLMPVYKKGGSDAVDSEWRKFRMARVTKAVHEISKTDADAIVADHVSQSVYDGWFRGADSGYKPKLVDAMLSSPEMRTAGLSLAYENYRNCTDSPLSFEKFLTTPITMYRGGHGQRHTKDDVFSAYTFDRKTAEHFAGKGGKITEAKIRPIDTYGSMRAVGESEIWVPREIAPNGNTDSRADGRIKLMSVTDLRFAFESVKGLFRKRLANGEESAIVKADTNLDADDPDTWITMPNGVHVPVKNGKAAGGPIKGKPVKTAKSKETGGKGKLRGLSHNKDPKEPSLPMTEIEKYKVGKDINALYHARYKGKRKCYIATRSNDPDSPVYIYKFINHGFDKYDIIHKKDTDDY